ncbi:hypothetical protein D3C74_338940 [compost metagenome]
MEEVDRRSPGGAGDRVGDAVHAQPGRGADDVGILLEEGCGPLHEGLGQAVVAVQHDRELGGQPGQPGVAGRAHARVLLAQDLHQAVGAERVEDRERPCVRRAVVDHDDLVGCTGLPQHRLDGLSHQVSLVEPGHDHAHGCSHATMLAATHRTSVASP